MLRGQRGGVGLIGMELRPKERWYCERQKSLAQFFNAEYAEIRGGGEVLREKSLPALKE
jgi:hypothetical protein